MALKGIRQLHCQLSQGADFLKLEIISSHSSPPTRTPRQQCPNCRGGRVQGTFLCPGNGAQSEQSHMVSDPCEHPTNQAKQPQSQ